ALAGIEVTSPPDRVVYTQGEELDLTGLEVTASYDDESTAVVPNADLQVSGYDSQVLGEQSVTVAYTQQVDGGQGGAQGDGPQAVALAVADDAVTKEATFAVTVEAADGGGDESGSDTGSDGAADAGSNGTSDSGSDGAAGSGSDGTDDSGSDDDDGSEGADEDGADDADDEAGSEGVDE